MSKRLRGPLTLLLTSRRFRRWAALVLALPIIYVASFGPACWLAAEPAPSSPTSPGLDVPLIPKWFVIYRPIGWLARYGHWVARYAIFWMPPGTQLSIPSWQGEDLRIMK